jgi:hypothetical protein
MINCRHTLASICETAKYRTVLTGTFKTEIAP